MIIENFIYDYLEKQHIPYKKTGNNFIMTTCLNPTHKDSKPSFSINTLNGNGVCFSCGFRVKKEFWLYDKKDDEIVEEINRDILYKKIEKLYYGNKKDKENITLYLPPVSETKIPDGWRSLSKETINKYNIYYCDYGHFEDRVIFPMEDINGNLIAFNSRAYGEPKKGMQKYKYSKGIKINEIIYPSIIKGKNYIVLVEGIMDALSMHQDGIPAILNFGVNNTFSYNKISYLIRNGIDTVYIALDNDEAGIKGTINYLHSELSDYFNVKHGILCEELKKFYNSKCKDYNEFISTI